MVDETLEMQKETEYDLVIVGAVPSGIVLARFYLSIYPTHRLAILEQEDVIGGVWSSGVFSPFLIPSTISYLPGPSFFPRQYPGFRSESGLRMTDFSDIPIVLPPDVNTYHDTVEAKYVTKYLEEYVDVHVYNKKTIATGRNSVPYISSFPNQANFISLIVHQKHFGQISKSALEPDSPYTAITILGGVSWLIRQSGEGPAIFAGAKGRGQYRNGAEMSATRAFSSLSPSCFAEQTWLSKLIHRSSISNSMVSKIWKGAEEATKLADFERGDALPGFENLKPESEIFWYNGPIGLIHHDDFWDTVARNVRVYRGDIAKLGSHAKKNHACGNLSPRTQREKSSLRSRNFGIRLRAPRTSMKPPVQFQPRLLVCTICLLLLMTSRTLPSSSSPTSIFLMRSDSRKPRQVGAPPISPLIFRFLRLKMRGAR
ncbi:hypothetical protein BOTCAL_0110g00110 [Botryotinia calthae]|uniref:FAD/NAD(P)-binding domain-containing protein n=1 Tax=Botryotinia calthae TaxID=38488 RepID=A0A4Y8D5R4_9HELO|nr:hypothetical protein BOTCAL_0110g00110 [Botryotinia calthae]